MSYQPLRFVFNSFLQGLNGSHEHEFYQPFHEGWYQIFIFQLLYCVSVYDPLLPSGIKVLKNWIDKEYSIFQCYWSIKMLQCNLDSLSFLGFYLQGTQYNFYVRNLSPPECRVLKGQLGTNVFDNFHFKKFEFRLGGKGICIEVCIQRG